MDKITIMSYAKINLSIDVGAPDSRGYHQVDMIMQQLDFHDDVEVGFYSNDNLSKGVHSISLKSNKADIPTDEGNIAFRAAALMSERYGADIPNGKIDIYIEKRIPVAAGMAGGSGNGAAVIHGLNALWDLKLPLKEIMELCSVLGSDVPFCAMGQAKYNDALPGYLRADTFAAGCARATGTGTVLKPLKGIRVPLLFAKPDCGVSTKEVYRGIDKCEITLRPDNDRLEELLKAGSDEIYSEFINVLEQYTLKAYPEIEVLKELLRESGAKKVLMSGSGSTVFAVYESLEEAEAEKQVLGTQGYIAHTTYTTE